MVNSELRGHESQRAASAVILSEAKDHRSSFFAGSP